MPSDQSLVLEESALAGKGILLEVRTRKDEAPRLIPATVQNLAPGVVTVEIDHPGNCLDWEDLPEEALNLHLMPETAGKPVTIPGKVSWAKYPGEAEGPYLCLGLELAGPTPSVQIAPEEHLRNNPADLKQLWDQWDQLNSSQTTLFGECKFYLIGLGLLTEGLSLQLLGHPLVGLASAFLGLLTISGKGLHSLWQRIQGPAKP
jgi:hypothetical protein